MARCHDRDDGVKETASLINDVSQTLVMCVGQIPLEGSGLNGVDWQNGNQDGMATQGFFIRAH
jgi:hypothetical protein